MYLWPAFSDWVIVDGGGAGGGCACDGVVAAEEDVEGGRWAVEGDSTY